MGGSSENSTEQMAPNNARLVNREVFLTRINASPGFWMCILLPFAYVANNARYSKSSSVFDYKMTSFVSLGLCFQSIFTFMCMAFRMNKLMEALLTLLPGTFTAVVIQVFLEQNIVFSIFWGFLTTLLYKFIYFALLRSLPKSFTYGEASVAAQGLLLFLLNGALQIPNFISHPPSTNMGEMNAIMITALICLVGTLALLSFLKYLRSPWMFYPLMVLLVAVVCTVPVTKDFPVVCLWNFIMNDFRRLCIVALYLGLVGATIVTVNWRLRKMEKASTVVRKLFHLLVVFVYVPGLLYQCTFLYIASGVALGVITVIETIRVLKIPPLYDSLEKSFNVFADEKDSGIVALTPFYLLIGCSLPMWISPNTCTTTDNALTNIVPLLAGVLTVGVGDTAASAIGSTIGKYKWPNSKKTVEGTIGNILTQIMFIYMLATVGYLQLRQLDKLTTGIAIIISSFVEAFTDQVDNLALPLIFYIICAI